jgi:predicted lipid-binding transport protein (Tim44 family)
MNKIGLIFLNYKTYTRKISGEHMKKLFTILLVTMVAFASVNAEANKRMGGGKNVGQQSSNVSKKQAAPQAQTPPPQAAPAATPSRPWGAMLGGLAAGLGLAWLAHSLGMGEAFGNILMALLIGAIVLGAIAWFMRKHIQSNSPNLAYQGPQINPVVNQPTQFQGDSMIGSALTTTWDIPTNFDATGFESAAKQNFILLQRAWDIADIATLSNMMTDTMLKEIQEQLASRDINQEYKTTVVSLEAKLLGIEETESNFIASVEFTGTIQETVGNAPEAFKEVWNITKSKSVGGWVLAGIQVK